MSNIQLWKLKHFLIIFLKIVLFLIPNIKFHLYFRFYQVQMRLFVKAIGTQIWPILVYIFTSFTFSIFELFSHFLLKIKTYLVIIFVTFLNIANTEPIIRQINFFCFLIFLLFFAIYILIWENSFFKTLFPYYSNPIIRYIYGWRHLCYWVFFIFKF